MQVCEDEHLQCRARAMECVGLVAKAVGKEDMQPFIPNLMKAAFQVPVVVAACTTSNHPVASQCHLTRLCRLSLFSIVHTAA